MGCCADDKEAGHTGTQRFMRYASSNLLVSFSVLRQNIRTNLQLKTQCPPFVYLPRLKRASISLLDQWLITVCRLNGVLPLRSLGFRYWAPPCRKYQHHGEFRLYGWALSMGPGRSRMPEVSWKCQWAVQGFFYGSSVWIAGTYPGLGGDVGDVDWVGLLSVLWSSNDSVRMFCAGSRIARVHLCNSRL